MLGRLQKILPWRFKFEGEVKGFKVEDPRLNMTNPPFSKSCPKCASGDHVGEKLLLIDKLNAAALKEHPDYRNERCGCEGDLSVDALKSEFVQDDPLQQFVLGFYCEACGIGFVPDEMAKPFGGWVRSYQGWHRVNADGSIGPPQERSE
jgi:hypothetical protein